MIYLILPMAIWGLTIAFLRYTRGQSGFDLFFRHFVAISGAGLAGFVMYKFSLTELGFPLFMAGVGLHSLALFFYALGLALDKRFRRRPAPSF